MSQDAQQVVPMDHAMLHVDNKPSKLLCVPVFEASLSGTYDDIYASRA